MFQRVTSASCKYPWRKLDTRKALYISLKEACYQAGTINTLEGSLLLDDILAKYHKLFGIPLYLAEYGSCKLVNLIKNVSDAFYIEGQGNRKLLCLRESATTSHTPFFNSYDYPNNV